MARQIICGIYKITTPSGRLYIGQSKDILHRWYRYKTYQCPRQPMLFASLKKYSSENCVFEILHELPCDVSRDVMNNYEELYISLYKTAGIELLNLNEGGHKNQELSESTRQKLRESATGKKYWLGRKHTEEAKQKIRDGNTGVKFTEERLKNMSLGNTGKPSPRKGVKLSEETKQKIRNARLGKPLSEEHKRKISEGGKLSKLKKVSNINQ